MGFIDFLVGGDANDSIFGSTGTTVLLTVIAVLAVLAFVLLAVFNRKNNFNTESIVFGAICIALSFALSYVKIFTLPQGGSITIASILPIAIYAYIFGFTRGLLVGIVYSVLQILQEPWIINFIQILLDYTIAFSAIAIIGLVPKFTKKLKTSQNKVLKTIGKYDLTIGIIIYAIIRFASHVISGVVFFSTWAGDTPALIYSLSYNSVVFIDALIAIIPAIALQCSKQFRVLTGTIQNSNLNIKKSPEQSV